MISATSRLAKYVALEILTISFISNLLEENGRRRRIMMMMMMMMMQESDFSQGCDK